MSAAIDAGVDNATHQAHVAVCDRRMVTRSTISTASATTTDSQSARRGADIEYAEHGSAFATKTD
jgi:hypothetical protein